MVKMWRYLLLLTLNCWIVAREAAAGNDTLLAIPFLFPYHLQDNCSQLYPAEDSSKYKLFYTSQVVSIPTSVVAYTVHIPSQETPGICKRHPQITYRFQLMDYAVERTFQSEDEFCNTSYSLCYQCKNKVRALTIHFKDNPSLSMIVHLFGSHFNQSLAVYPMSYSTDDYKDNVYTYKVLFGAQRQGLMDGVVIHVMHSGTNVTIHTPAGGDVIALRNNKEYLFYESGQTIHLTEQCRNAIFWIEPNVSDCGRPMKRQLEQIRIESSDPIKVFTNQAYCNQSGGFSYHSQLIHEMPPPNKWGRRFVVDVQQAQILPASARSTLQYELSILSSQHNNIIDVMYYRKKKIKNGQVTTDIEQYNGTVLISKASGFIEEFTHISIHATHPVLIIYNIHNSATLEGHEKIYYSIVAQPVSWFSNIQTIALSGTNSSQANYEYHVSVTIPKTQYNPQDILISTTDSFLNGTPLSIYEGFDDKTFTSVDYILLNLTPHASSYKDNDSLLIWHKNPTVDIGTTVFAYSSERHYAYSSGYIQDGSPRDLSRLQTPRSPPVDSKTIVIAILSLLLLTVAVVLIVVCYCRKRGAKRTVHVRDDEELLIPEEPGSDFEYDVFILFSDEDEQLVRACLFVPLQTKGYKVLWKYDPSHNLFQAGADIVSDLSVAIQISRKILVVCTRNLCEKEAFERDVSFFEDVQKSERKRRLIPFVLEKEFNSHQFRDYNQIRVKDREDLLSHTAASKEAMQKLVNNLGKPLDQSAKEICTFITVL